MSSPKPLACVRCGAPIPSGFECAACSAPHVRSRSTGVSSPTAGPKRSDGPRLAFGSLLGLAAAGVLVYGAIDGTASLDRDKAAAARKRAAQEAKWAREEEERKAREALAAVPPPTQQAYAAPAPVPTQRAPRYFAAVFTCTRCSRSCYTTWTTNDGSRQSFINQAYVICVGFVHIGTSIQHCPAATDGASCHVEVRFMDLDEVPAGTYHEATLDDVESFF